VHSQIAPGSKGRAAPKSWVRGLSYAAPAARGGRGTCGRAADTSAARGPKRRAKTDWADAQLLRELLADGRLPESWIPPAQVLEMRARLQLLEDLREQHTAWVQPIHTTHVRTHPRPAQSPTQ
jgi:hypothetical protein